MSKKGTKNDRSNIRVSAEDTAKLNYVKGRTGMSKTDIWLKGLDLIYKLERAKAE